MNTRIAMVVSLSAVLLATGVATAPVRTQKATIHESPHKRLSNSCEECHVATSFRDIRFDHGRTGFPLDGHHRRAACLDCHSVADFSLVENTCASCHEDVHRARLGPDCSRCHGGQGWAVIDAEAIHASTNFPLLGRHTTLDCESCHRGMRVEGFRQTSTQCVGCHREDYLATSSPAHATGGFSTDCQTCHNVLGWTPATMVDHEPMFPIFSGTHRGRWSACAECHIVPNTYATVSCIDCHTHAQSLTDPTHQGMTGYTYTTQACLSCHPTGVADDFREHDAAFFPVYSGAHLRRWDKCLDCHPTPSNKQVFTCVDCHDHVQTLMDPVHQGFNGYAYDSPTCLGCHPTGQAGEFRDHDATEFPIYSGVHRGKWNDCGVCHPTPTNKQVFTCIDCHEHSQQRMDDKHLGEVNNYVFSATSCYDCHPNGRKD